MGFLGGNITLDIYYPQVRDKIFETQTKEVTFNDIEFRNIERRELSSIVRVVNADIDITNSQIIYKIKHIGGGSFASVGSGGFNGYRLSDQDDSLDAIMGFSIDPEWNSLDLPQSRVSFNQDAIQVNVAGLLFENRDVLAINVIFSRAGKINGTGHNDIIRSDVVSEVINGFGGNDQISGQAGNDKIFGGKGNDVLRGDAGADILVGDSGNDLLIGGDGIDTLKGGSGYDNFFFDSKTGKYNVDRIVDFSSADDTIRLENDVFRAISLGELARSQFKDVSHGAKLDANDRIIYNQNNGHLYYDSDGSGQAGKVLVAVIENHAAIDHRDFLIV